MRTILIVLTLCLVGLPAEAASPLPGQWRVAAESQPTYEGTVLIDQDGRATWDAADDNGGPKSYRGYVSSLKAPTVEIIFTNGIRVTRAHCLLQSPGLLHCHNVYGDGKTSA